MTSLPDTAPALSWRMNPGRYKVSHIQTVTVTSALTNEREHPGYCLFLVPLAAAGEPDFATSNLFYIRYYGFNRWAHETTRAQMHLCVVTDNINIGMDNFSVTAAFFGWCALVNIFLTLNLFLLRNICFY